MASAVLSEKTPLHTRISSSSMKMTTTVEKKKGAAAAAPPPVAVATAGYGTMSARLVPRISRGDEGKKIIQRIDAWVSNGYRTFMLLDYVHDLDASPGVNPWWSVLDEKRFLAEYFIDCRIVPNSDVKMERESMCGELQDADPEYLRILYAVVAICDVNDYVYYIRTKETIGMTLPTPDVASVEKRFRHYIIWYNGYETSHRRLLRTMAARPRHSIPLLPAPAPARSSVAIIDTGGDEEDDDVDDESGSTSNRSEAGSDVLIELRPTIETRSVRLSRTAPQ